MLKVIDSLSHSHVRWNPLDEVYLDRVVF